MSEPLDQPVMGTPEINPEANQDVNFFKRNLWWLITIVFLVVSLIISFSSQSLNKTVKEKRFTPIGRVTARGSTKAQLATADDPYFGNKSAKVTVVEFADYQCPYCREAFPIVRQLMTDYRDRLLFIYRDFPVSDRHPLAQKAAEAGQCVWDEDPQDFWAFHDRVYQNQDQLSESQLISWAVAAGIDQDFMTKCLSSGQKAPEVANDFSDGLALGVSGTPTFFINGRQFKGVISEDVFRKLLEAAIKETA